MPMGNDRVFGEHTQATPLDYHTTLILFCKFVPKLVTIGIGIIVLLIWEKGGEWCYLVPI